MRLHREGVRDGVVAIFAADGEEISPAEAAAIARGQTTPGPTVDVPEFGPPTAEAIARGRDLYVQQTCNSCHGDEGVGVWDIPLVDQHLQPTRPRDLVHEPFEGGVESEAVSLRIVAGMPGTPHPASPNLTGDQLVDLVHYCLSLSETPKLELTNYQRAALDTGSAYLRALGRDFGANSVDSDDFLESVGSSGR
jgi:mono/diheme cytochrome c family protein